MKKPFIYLLTAGLAVSMIANTGTIYAEGTYKSNATVTFTAPTDSVPVVDPETLEEDPDVEGTGDLGPLSLDFVSNIDFDSEFIEVEGDTYESTTERPFIQVTDRRGPGEGWHVNAALSSFYTGVEGSEKPSLPGAVIYLNNGEADSKSQSVDPEVNKQIILNSTEIADNIVSTTEKQENGTEGLGTWVVRWLASEDEVDTNDNVTLMIPAASATAGTHTAEINWTLTSGPTQISNVVETEIIEEE